MMASKTIIEKQANTKSDIIFTVYFILSRVYFVICNEWTFQVSDTRLLSVN